MTSFTHYILDGTKVVAQYQTSTSSITPSNVIYFYYDESGSPTGMKYNGNVYFFQKNLQGDIIRILNTQGSIVATYTYDAWGNIISSTDTSGVSIGTKNPFRYRGYYYDTETGLYYLNSRYYDPQVGRFLNADGLVSTGQGLLGSNMFAYCLNNPVKNVDHMGAAAKHILQRLTGEGMVYEEYESLLREYNNLILSEHRKRGTTNKANREKHQRGQSRKLKDNGGEKKDSRMHPNPNKRKPLKQSAEIEYDNYVYDKQTNNELSNFNIPMKQEVSLLDKIGASIMLVGSLGVVVYVVANDSTGIGVADDGCLAFLIPFIQKT